MTMNRSQIQNIILNHLHKYNPVKIGIFGSFARGESEKDSDIDVLVEFKDSPSLLTLIRLENELSDLVGTRVDLVTTGAIKNKRIRTSIKKDIIYLL
jgi:predicted nucleotidyltransferase